MKGRNKSPLKRLQSHPAERKREKKKSRDSLLLQEGVHALVLPHKDDVLAMQPDVEGTAQSASDADQGEDEEFLRIEGEIHGEVGGEHRRDGLLALEPDRQQAEHRSAAHSREEAPPVVPYREVHRGDFDAEEHTADRRCEAGGDADGAGGRQHLTVPALVLVYALEACDQFGEQSRDDAGDVHEWTLLAER